MYNYKNSYINKIENTLETLFQKNLFKWIKHSITYNKHTTNTSIKKLMQNIKEKEKYHFDMIGLE